MSSVKDGLLCFFKAPHTGVLNGPENYSPNLTPHVPALFSSHTYRNFMQRRQFCVCPSPWSRQPDLLFTTAMIHNKQYIIHNLQEMCFIKKEARGPTRPGSFVYIFGPNPTHWELYPTHRPDSNKQPLSDHSVASCLNRSAEKLHWIHCFDVLPAPQ